jgi:hypothetical protein
MPIMDGRPGELEHRGSSNRTRLTTSANDRSETTSNVRPSASAGRDPALSGCRSYRLECRAGPVVTVAVASILWWPALGNPSSFPSKRG